MTAPLVSVITTVYNTEDFLGEALASAAAQAYAPIEIIVVDDGSTDASLAVARSFAARVDRDVRCLKQDHVGRSAALNVGVDAASGEIVAFLDADDRWPPGKLSLQVGYLIDHPDVSLVFGQQELFGARDITTLTGGRVSPPWYEWVSDWDRRVEVPMMSIVGWRRVFEDVGAFDTAFQVAADVDWFLRARESGFDFAIIPEVVLHRRVHDRNLTREDALNRREHLLVMKRCMERRRA